MQCYFDCHFCRVGYPNENAVHIALKSVRNRLDKLASQNEVSLYIIFIYYTRGRLLGLLFMNLIYCLWFVHILCEKLHSCYNLPVTVSEICAAESMLRALLCFDTIRQTSRRISRLEWWGYGEFVCRMVKNDTTATPLFSVPLKIKNGSTKIVQEWWP